jgi:hypothetical protein
MICWNCGNECRNIKEDSGCCACFFEAILSVNWPEAEKYRLDCPDCYPIYEGTKV